jgi:hypothetical protein
MGWKHMRNLIMGYIGQASNRTNMGWKRLLYFMTRRADLLLIEPTWDGNLYLAVPVQ